MLLNIFNLPYLDQQKYLWASTGPPPLEMFPSVQQFRFWEFPNRGERVSAFLHLRHRRIHSHHTGVREGAPAELGSIILGGWPSWGAPAPQTPRTWRLRRQQGRGGLRPPRPKWGGGGLRPPPPHFGDPCWRRRRQVRGVWGAGAPQEGQPPRIMLPSCAGGQLQHPEHVRITGGRSNICKDRKQHTYSPLGVKPLNVDEVGGSPNNAFWLFQYGCDNSHLCLKFARATWRQKVKTMQNDKKTELE